MSTLSSLQLQKQHEDAELRNLQSAKLRVAVLIPYHDQILEELVAEQQAASSLRTSLQALKQEKDAQTKELERVAPLPSLQLDAERTNFDISRT